MEQDMENNIHEDSIALFDDSMLSKLRRCNIVPRSPSDFQVFVKSLAGDTISDVVILEAWKQIYPGYASLQTPEKDFDTQERALNDSSKSEGNVADFLPEFSGKELNQKHESHFGNQIFKKTKKSSCESGSDLDTSLSVMTTQHPISNQIITLHSFAPVSKKEMNRKITCSVKTLEEINQACAGKRNESKVSLEEQNSSDCEIIEIVSLDSTGANHSNSGSEIVSNNGGNTSDSDESVEILDSSENEVDKGMKRLCPIHGSHKTSKAQHSQNGTCSKRKSTHIEADSVERKDNESCEGSVYKGKQRGRRGKYEKVKSELKHLKSVLNTVLLSLKSSALTDSGKSNINLENLSFTLLNNQKGGGNESFGPKQSRKKTGSKSTSRVSSTEKLHASAFVEVNMSRKTTEVPPKNSHTAKHTENCSEQPPIMVDLNSDTEDKEKRKKFLWRENIVTVLKSKPGKWMSVEKLKRIVIARYYYFRGNVSNNTTVKFFRYLHSTAGVFVDGDMAIYSSKPIIKVSSKSERKQVVLKTRKTTKEYKVS